MGLMWHLVCIYIILCSYSHTVCPFLLSPLPPNIASSSCYTCTHACICMMYAYILILDSIYERNMVFYFSPLLQPHLAYLSILLDSFPLSLKLQWHRNQKHPFSLGPVFPSISTHHNNISITLAACWGLSFNHVDNGFWILPFPWKPLGSSDAIFKPNEDMFSTFSCLLKDKACLPSADSMLLGSLLLQAPSYMKKADASWLSTGWDLESPWQRTSGSTLKSLTPESLAGKGRHGPLPMGVALSYGLQSQN